MSNRINVTQTHLPSLEEYSSLVKEIWDSGQLTNYGQFCEKLENELRSRLGVKHLILVSNGTIAIQLAIKALGLEGDVITTPFSYVATVSSLFWEGCTPVFVDINERDFCIDPDKIEAAITPKTSAILATHVYGFPCEVEKIQAIAKRHNLKIIYDAAHAFDVELNGKSLLNQGDISTLSFHATKVFHTGEGGAVMTNNDDLAHRLRYLGNFGHDGQEDFFGVGVNAKISEFHAAMGLCMLPHMSLIKSNRKAVVQVYTDILSNYDSVYLPSVKSNVNHNYSYFPVIFESETLTLKVQSSLNEENIFPRRYFYPSLNKLPYVKPSSMPIAESIASRILCLPLSSQITIEETERIASIISENL